MIKKASFLFSGILNLIIIMHVTALPVEDYLDDLSIYRTIMETMHTGMYLYTSKEDFDVLFKNAQERIKNKEIQDTREFLWEISHIHEKIHCGHSTISVNPRMFPRSILEDKIFFPIPVIFINDKLIVAQDFNRVKKGSTILAINNIPVEELTKALFDITSSDGYNITGKYHQVAENFPFKYYLVYGKQSSFHLTIMPYMKTTRTSITIQAVPFTETVSTPPSQKHISAEKNNPLFNIRYLNKDTALLTIHSFYTGGGKEAKKFFNFLKKTFKKIKKKKIMYLILDIRDNEGGDDGNDIELASYLIDKPFREDKYRKLRTTQLPLYPEYLHPTWYQFMNIPQDTPPDQIKETIQKELAPSFTKGKDGMYYLKEKYILKRKPKKNRFTGEVFVLISGKVFSGGALFSGLIRDKTKAVFIGQETGGGYYRHTGSIPFIYTLPHSRIAFSLFVVINEQNVERHLVPNGRGIIPQKEVYLSIEDYMQGKDTVLEYTKELIRSIKANTTSKQ